MYASEFGTDWTSLTRDAAITRAYALGVAELLGERHPEELPRIIDQMETAYGRSLVELSFEEGKAKARDHTADTPDAIWDELVRAGTPDLSGEAPEPRDGIPGSVTRIEMLNPPGDNLDRIRLPEFLFR